MKSLRFIVPLVAFLVMAAFLAVGLNRDPREVPSPLIGKPAPNFKMALLHDASRSLSSDDFKGKVWMLNVWASWCAACRDEHPLLVEFAKERHVPLIGLNYKDSRVAGQRWLQSFGNPYDDSLFDEQGRLGMDFGVYGVPETFIIDREGKVRFKHIGPITPAVLQQKMLPLIKALHG